MTTKRQWNEKDIKIMTLTRMKTNFFSINQETLQTAFMFSNEDGIDGAFSDVGPYSTWIVMVLDQQKAM